MGNGKGKTSKYYTKLKRENPKKYQDTRIAQQTKYNKHGSSKPGTKDITGNEIARKATNLNRELNTYGNGDGKDASHNMYGKGKHGTENASNNRARPRKKKNKNKSKLYIT